MRRISTHLDYKREGRLFGRQEEQETLSRVYQKLKESPSSNVDFVLISGEAGIGKTALAHSLKNMVDEDDGFFVGGKFEQLKSLEPTQVFISALTDLTNQIMDREENAIERYRQAVVDAMGNECKLLTDTIPALKRILGAQEEIQAEHGQGADAVNRFRYLFLKFLDAFSSPDHPIVFLLDDLHWADESSLGMLESLATDVSINGVMFLGTYRDDETNNSDFLKRKLEHLEQSNQVCLHRIHIGSLGKDSVRQMLSEVLVLDPDQIRILTRTIYSWTQGNVFFILELLRLLQDEELLRFDNGTSQWTCDNHLIQVTVDAHNAHELFRAKILELPEKVQNVLKLSSCIGSKLDEYILSTLLSEQVSDELQIAAEKGLIVHDTAHGFYVFANDGIQEATYNLIPSGDKEIFSFGDRKEAMEAI